MADSDLVASAFPTFSRPPSSLPLLCGQLRSCHLSLYDVLKATVMWLTQISLPQPFLRSQGRRPHCHCCVADSDLVASAFRTFSRPPSSLPLHGKLTRKTLLTQGHLPQVHLTFRHLIPPLGNFFFLTKNSLKKTHQVMTHTKGSHTQTSNEK